MIREGRHTVVPTDINCNIDLFFGSFCSIASGLVIVSGQHPAVANPLAISNFPFAEYDWGPYPECQCDGSVRVGNDVWIGQNVTIMEGVSVGDGAVIAAGAVVAKDVPPYAVAAGNPATIVKHRFDQHTVERLLAIAWWKWNDRRIAAALPDMSDVRGFIEKHDFPK